MTRVPDDSARATEVPAKVPFLEHLLKGEMREAEKELLDALRKAPLDPDLHLAGVRLYHELNEPERAAMHLGRARELLQSGGAAPDTVAHEGGPAAGVARLRLAEALDHLAHRDAQAASDILATLASTEALSDPALRLEALVLAAEAEMALANGFRAFKHVERALREPATLRPDLRVRLLVLLGRYQDDKGNHDHADEALLEAKALAERLGLVDLGAEVSGALAEHTLRYAPAGEKGRLLRDRASRLQDAARETLLRVAATLPEERKRAYLTHPRRQRLAVRGADAVGADLGTLVSAPERGSARAPARSTASRLVATLSEMSSLINSMTDLDTLLERVMDIALEIIGAERGLVVLIDVAADRMEVKVARNLEGGADEGIKEFSRHVVREVAKGREIVAVDTAADSWMKEQRSVALHAVRSLVCFPLRSKDTVIGAVYLDNQKQIRTYNEEDLDFLRVFTNLAAIAIENARLMTRLQEENVYLKRVASDKFKSTNIIGTGPSMEKIFRLVDKAMDSTFPVLVTGETGTGKEVFTKAIHFGSTRKDKPFVAQNCAAIPSELLESEMFGYKRGAFTGAEHDKKGLFEIASGGTLFLDEIGELDLTLQAKLLRVLQEGMIRRVGETSERHVDVRIIAATNRNLKESVEQGTFRLDLYYRLNVLQIDLPPLRARPEDVPLLAQMFLEKACKQMGRTIRGFTNRAIEKLVRYPWPGNVRELENAIARAVVFADRDVVDLESLPSFLVEADSPTLVPPGSALSATVSSGAGGGQGPGGSAPAGSSAAAAPGGRAGLDPSAAQKARQILDQMDATNASFWDAVKEPFMRRNLSREVAREVVRLGLERSGWKYTRALQALHVDEGDYRRFMNFLAKFNLKVDRPSGDEHA